MKKKAILGIFLFLFGIFFLLYSIISGDGELSKSEIIKREISGLCGFIVLVIGLYSTLDSLLLERVRSKATTLSYTTLILGIIFILSGGILSDFLSGYLPLIGIVLTAIGLAEVVSE